MAKKQTAVAAKLPANRGQSAWLIASYAPVSLFSLRMTHATSKGGKTLIVPTPYSVKMALIDVCYRHFHAPEADRRAREFFDWIKGREIRVLPPSDCIVQNTFVKILDHDRDGNAQFKNTIAYREFAYFRGTMNIAIATGDSTDSEMVTLRALLATLNYLGKRGSFWQFVSDSMHDRLPEGFTIPLDQPSWDPARYGMIQALDDFGDSLCAAKDGFERISTYGVGTIKLGDHRVLRETAIPYRRRSATRHSTWYQRSVNS